MNTLLPPGYSKLINHSTSVEIYEKYYAGKLSGNLTHAEFRCKCDYKDCTFTMVNHRVVTAFQLTRKHWGRAIGVSSGYRCQRHNEDSKGVWNSWHRRGFAIDIFSYHEDMDILYEIAQTFFDLVIWYKEDNFLHCQMEA